MCIGTGNAWFDNKNRYAVSVGNGQKETVYDHEATYNTAFILKLKMNAAFENSRNHGNFRIEDYLELLQNTS